MNDYFAITGFQLATMEIWYKDEKNIISILENQKICTQSDCLIGKMTFIESLGHLFVGHQLRLSDGAIIQLTKEGKILYNGETAYQQIPYLDQVDGVIWGH